jgi:hypothetical protein
MKDSIQKLQTPRANAWASGKLAASSSPDTALQRLVDSSPRQLMAQAQLTAQKAGAMAGPIQRAILKPRSRTETYKVFPKKQLQEYGMLDSHEHYARKLFNKKDKNFTLAATVRFAKMKYNNKNRGVRVLRQGAGTRLNTHLELINHFENQSQDATKLRDKFITNNHGSAFDALLAQVPLTDMDLLASPCASSTASSIYSDLTGFINREHVPTMVRTPSYLCETIDAMTVADTSVGSGYVSSNKGSMFEAFSAQNFIPGSARVTVLQQGSMNCTRTSDGFAGNVLYDAKFYEGTMSKSTNSNQWYDYKEIVTNGYTGSNGEMVNSICYIFPHIQAAQNNTHLKATDIRVAYLDKNTGGLKYV